MRLLWTDEAFKSLKDIYNYIARDSKYYASLEVEKILAFEKQISKYPKSGRIVPEYSDETIREILSGNYRIIYKIMDEKEIEVITIVHASRDLSNL